MEKLKVYIMTDLEGVAGVMNSTDYIYPESRYYENAKALLTREVNAAVEGFFAAGAGEIVVHDGHGHGGINIELLDSRAKLQRGWHGPGGAYPFGLDMGYDVYACVGQHPKAGTEYGHICHTGSFEVLDYSVNGISVGEFGQQVLLAGQYGVTPIFASGCLAFTKEARALVPGIETVAVKEGITPGSGAECSAKAYEYRNWGAIHLQPQKARELISEGACRALRRFCSAPESFRPPKILPPFSKIEIYRGECGNGGKTVRRGEFENLAECLNA